jgi:hypothetical protein
LGLQGSAGDYRYFREAITAISRLLDQVREATRRCRYSKCNEDDYVLSVKRLILLHDQWHPLEMVEFVQSKRVSIPPKFRQHCPCGYPFDTLWMPCGK